MYVIKEELGHLEEMFAIIIQVVLLKKLPPDPVQLFRIWIRPGQKFPIQQNPDPQHSHRPLIEP